MQRTLAGLHALLFDIEIRVCGFPGAALVPVDVDLSAIGDPRHLVFASIERMAGDVEAFDFFLNIEDDILITPEVVTASIAFCGESAINEVLLPNRVEDGPDGLPFCVDLLALPGWDDALVRRFGEMTLGVARNAHSGLSVLSRAQLRYAIARVDLARRTRIIGDYMASAYANLHAPFVLWRSRPDVLAHHVVHLDPWLESQEYLSLRPGTEHGNPSPPPDSGVAERSLGYIDGVFVDGPLATVRGWAVTPGGVPATEFELAIDGHVMRFSASDLRPTARPDVVTVYPHADERCGFELTLPVGTLFQLQDRQPATVSLTFRSTADGPLLSLSPGGAEEVGEAVRKTVTELPRVPDAPLLPDAVAARWRELLLESEVYLEYGTGATTVLATSTGRRRIVAVESDALWLEGVRHKVNRQAGADGAHLLHVDLGPVGEWGYPRAETNWRRFHRYALDGWQACAEQVIQPDLVLIDGRFRVACLLSTLLHARPGCRVLVDDYAERPHYASVEQFVAPAMMVDRCAEFVVPHEVPRDQIWTALLSSVADPR